MKKIIFPFLLLLLCAARSVAQDRDDSNSDIQLWPDVSIGIRIKPDVTWTFFATARPGRNLTAFITEQLGTAVNFRVNKNLNITPSYRHIWSPPLPGRGSQENRYFVDVTPRLPLGREFTLVNRNRLELREINDRLSWRYRNRVQLEKALTWHEHSFTPYVAGEIFYDSRFESWSRRQLWTGLRFLVTKHLTLDGLYMRNVDSRATPGNWHVIGMMTRLEF